MCIASAKRWRASIWASPPRCWPRSSAAIPITVGATPEQKKLWLTRIAEEGLLFAYGATEPEAGSDLGALQTTADRVMQDGQIVGYKINGSKQWISNGGIADAYTVLANTPAGPSWFIVEKGAPGSRTTSRKTSTASASATPRPSRSTTSTWMPTG